jgi:hypothetical protein
MNMDFAGTLPLPHGQQIPWKSDKAQASLGQENELLDRTVMIKGC